MVRTQWTLEEAQLHLPKVLEQARQEPQFIKVQEETYIVTNLVKPSPSTSISTWDAMRGNFDFSDMGDEDYFERIKSDDRDIEW